MGGCPWRSVERNLPSRRKIPHGVRRFGVPQRCQRPPDYRLHRHACCASEDKSSGRQARGHCRPRTATQLRGAGVARQKAPRAERAAHDRRPDDTRWRSASDGSRTHVPANHGIRDVRGEPFNTRRRRVSSSVSPRTRAGSTRRRRQGVERGGGPNRLDPPAPASAGAILIDQLRSVVVLLLLAAAVISLAFGDRIEAAAIASVLVINAALGFVTELRARRAMEALLAIDVMRAFVLRDGRPRGVDAQQLVPGDVIELGPGQTVPADARLVVATDLRTNEAALTGESLPVAKEADLVLASETPLADRSNMVYKGTTVAAGAARSWSRRPAGDRVRPDWSAVGGIREERTPLERRLDALGRRWSGWRWRLPAPSAGLASCTARRSRSCSRPRSRSRWPRCRKAFRRWRRSPWRSACGGWLAATRSSPAARGRGAGVDDGRLHGQDPHAHLRRHDGRVCAGVGRDLRSARRPRRTGTADRTARSDHRGGRPRQSTAGPRGDHGARRPRRCGDAARRAGPRHRAAHAPLRSTRRRADPVLERTEADGVLPSARPRPRGVRERRAAPRARSTARAS